MAVGAPTRRSDRGSNTAGRPIRWDPNRTTHSSTAGTGSGCLSYRGCPPYHGCSRLLPVLPYGTVFKEGRGLSAARPYPINARRVTTRPQPGTRSRGGRSAPASLSAADTPKQFAVDRTDGSQLWGQQD